jgi:predicted HicB family RNase H-like nuclease
MLKYKGFHGTYEIDPDKECLHGQIVGAFCLLTYEAQTVAELKLNFIEVVEGYINFIKGLENGK